MISTRLSKFSTPALFAIATAFLVPAIAPARTKLVTLPERDRMVVSLENQNRTLVYEERSIPLQKGANKVYFSWQGVNIDPGSVLIEFLDHPGDGPDATRILSTGFPNGENALIWNVYTPDARTESVRVSYLMRGLAFESSYDMRMTADEKLGDFRHYITLTNGSGERLEEAVLRFRGMEDLSRSMESDETRRFFLGRNEKIDITKLYRTEPGYHNFVGEDGETISLVYELPAKSLPGEGPIKQGKVRIFGADGTGSSIFLGEDSLQIPPPNEEPKLTLSSVKDVKLERYLQDQSRTDVVYNNSNVPVKFNLVRHIRFELENFKGEAVTLDIREPMPQADWSVKEVTGDGVTTERLTINTLQLRVEVPAQVGNDPGKKTVDLVVTIKDVFEGEGF